MDKNIDNTKLPDDKSSNEELTTENFDNVDNKTNLTIDQRLSIISTCLSYAIYEANVYWQRNAIYLTINSIMFGAILAFSENWNNLLFLVVGMFGVFLNWHWLHVNKYSKFFAERWREDARITANEDEELTRAFNALLGKPRISAPKGKKPSRVMNQMSAFFRLLWIVISIIALVLVIIDLVKFISSLDKTITC